MLKKTHLSALAGAILFCSIFYLAVPFYFGLWNNEEELPLVYEMSGTAEYAGDPFVTWHTEHYSQVMPYIAVISTVARVLHVTDMFPLYVALHALFLALLYISIRGCFRVSSNGGEAAAFFTVLSLLIIIQLINPIPAGRWLFVNYLDPEFVTLPFLFFTVSSFAAGRYGMSYLSILIAAVIHPLYALPMLFAVSAGLLYRWYRGHDTFTGIFTKGLLYLVMVMPYTFLLWSLSRGEQNPGLDPSKILEFVRSPWHHKIPTITSPDAGSILFYAFSLICIGGAVCLFRKKPAPGGGFLPALFNTRAGGLLMAGVESVDANEAGKDKPESFENLMAVNVSLLIFLAGVSLIATFARIPLLVQLSPYRISSVVVALSLVLFASALVQAYKKYRVRLSFPGHILIWAIVIGTAAAGGAVFSQTHITPRRVLANRILSNERKMVQWVEKNTGRNELFINYSIVDLRTVAMRPVYFNFKSLPLTVDRQVDWYRRLRIQYDVPSNIKPDDYKKVRDYTGVDIHSRNEAFNLAADGSMKQYTVDLERVLSRSGMPVSWIVVPGISPKHRFDPGSLVPVYENGGYRVYRALRGSSK